VPVGIPSVENVLAPSKVISIWDPEVTAEKVLGELTSLPQESVPLFTEHLPLLVVIVKPDVDPESVYVAGVCADNVPDVRRPPTFDPDFDPLSVLFDGRDPGLPVGPEPVLLEVDVDDPLFGTYLIPEEGQVLERGESIATNCPSIREPLRLKYQAMVFNIEPLQPSAGVKPVSAFNALVSWDNVKVFELVGVIP